MELISFSIELISYSWLESLAISELMSSYIEEIMSCPEEIFWSMEEMRSSSLEISSIIELMVDDA